MNDTAHGLWGATAEPAPDTPPLPGDRVADVVIVGAGYTGLSAALHLAKIGVGVICIDRAFPGYGASGRNGGQVLPGFKTYPDHLIARFGQDRGAALAAFGAGMADDLFALVARHGIACAPNRTGWVHAGHTEAKLAEQRWKHDQWATRGAPVRWLDGPAIAERLGTEAYAGGWLDMRGGSVQPLSLARGLARAAMQAGAAVHGDTEAQSVQAEPDGWRVRTPHGTLRAHHVIVATNGYTGGLVPGLAASVVAVESAQVATAPLDDPSVLAGCAASSDTRRSLLYFRLSPDRRLVMGGRGGIVLGTGAASYDRLARAIATLYPALEGVPLTHRWAGSLAVTLDHLPHLHEPAPGLVVSLGCNGRGVAYSVAIGHVLAQRIVSGGWGSSPVPVSPLSPMPLHPFRRLGAALVAGWYGWRDRRDGVL
jgi:glycine/D-amino acid oxidase-like deaminating enzyme